MGGQRYDYRCPNCGTQLELRMRVTQTKRKCPHCGSPITPEEIDRQQAEMQKRMEEGCSGCIWLCCIPVGVLLSLTGVGAVIGVPLLIIGVVGLIRIGQRTKCKNIE